MTYRRTLVALCGAAAILCVGCDDDAPPEDGTGSSGTSSTGATSAPVSSSSGASDESSTGAELPTSSSEGGTSSGGDSTSEGGDATIGESDSDTEGPGDPFDCEVLGGVLITEFQADFPVFSVGGTDVVTMPVGTICMLPTASSWVLRLQFGPMEGADWTSTVRVQVEAPGTYDLGSDFGQPGSGEAEPNALSYALQEGAGTSSFDTSNQAADGTLQIDDWPAASGDEISVRADGNIAGVDGWRFQFSISAVLP